MIKKAEACISEVIDSGIAVHREVGPGYLESVYQDALCVELSARGISFAHEALFTVTDRDKAVGIHRLDLVVR